LTFTTYPTAAIPIIDPTSAAVQSVQRAVIIPESFTCKIYTAYSCPAGTKEHSYDKKRPQLISHAANLLPFDQMSPDCFFLLNIPLRSKEILVKNI